MGDVITFRNEYSSQQTGVYYLGNHFVKFMKATADREWKRPNGTVASTETKNVTYGDGAAPEILDIHYLPVRERGSRVAYGDYIPDYGLEGVSEEKTIIPEYCSMGALDVSGCKGGVDDEPYTSFNDRLVMSDDGTTKVPVNNTNYELILGQTSFNFSLDYSTFGHVYLKESYYDESTGTFRFKRYDTLLDYLAETGISTSKIKVTTFENSGKLGDVSINNKVDVYLTVSKGKISEEAGRSFIIRNVYDGFTVKFYDFAFENVFYGGLSGTFSYAESNPYVASCTLGGNSYTFQAIKDAKSAPLP